jgi:hypothetical protein
MTDDDGQPQWPPALLAQGMQEMTEQAADSQQQLYRQLLSATTGEASAGSLNPLSLGTATFKARVQSGGRISIPDAEREALDIGEGDLVQTIVVPIEHNGESNGN